MSLRAPLAVVVEIQADDRRWYRLSRNVGSDGLALVRAVPLEAGRPVQVRFSVPLPAAATASPEGDRGEALSLRAELTGGAGASGDGRGDDGGGDELVFIDPPRESRQVLGRYVKDRLGLHLR